MQRTMSLRALSRVAPELTEQTLVTHQGRVIGQFIPVVRVGRDGMGGGALAEGFDGVQAVRIGFGADAEVVSLERAAELPLVKPFVGGATAARGSFTEFRPAPKSPRAGG